MYSHFFLVNHSETKLDKLKCFDYIAKSSSLKCQCFSSLKNGKLDEKEALLGLIFTSTWDVESGTIVNVIFNKI